MRVRNTFATARQTLIQVIHGVSTTPQDTPSVNGTLTERWVWVPSVVCVTTSPVDVMSPDNDEVVDTTIGRPSSMARARVMRHC